MSQSLLKARDFFLAVFQLCRRFMVEVADVSEFIGFDAHPFCVQVTRCSTNCFPVRRLG